MRSSWKRVAAVLVLALVLLLALVTVASAAPPWSDAPNAFWVNGYGVTDIQVGTVAAGYDNGTFRPAQAVRRGEFAKMAVDGLGLLTTHPATPTFKDVPLNNGFYDWIEGAHSAGLANGTTTSTGVYYKPGDNISRQQANSILARYLSAAEIQATQVIHGTGGLTYGSLDLWFAAQGEFYLDGFDDAGQVAADHRATTAYLIFHQIVQGSNSKLTPGASLNRAQAATMVLRVKAEEVNITTPPGAPANLTTTPPSPGTDSTPRVSGTAIPGGLVHVYDTFGGSTTQVAEATANSAGNFVADLTTPLVDGTHSFTAKVRSTGGIVSPASAAVSYLLDTVAPTGSIISPVVPSGQPDAAVNSSKPTFTATAADALSGVKEVDFQYAPKPVALATPVYVGISTWRPADPAPNLCQAVWPSTGTLATGLEDGQYLFRIVVVDNTGNTTTVPAVNVTVDTVKPVATILLPQPNSGSIFYTDQATPPEPIFVANAGDTAKVITPAPVPAIQASGVQKVDFFDAPWSTTAYTLWTSFTPISTATSPLYGATWPSTGIADGDYLFAVRATDRASNESPLVGAVPGSYADGATQRVIVDRAAPVVTVTHPLAAASIPDNLPYNITWTLTDVSPPSTVLIDYWDGAAWVPLNGGAGVPVGTLSSGVWSGSYAWTTPDLAADLTTAKIRITATDLCGPVIGKAAAHTTVMESGTFTIFKNPAAPSILSVTDPDFTVGLDGRDFSVAWTPSASSTVVSYDIYILPVAVPLTLGAGQTPMDSVLATAPSTWTGTVGLTKDSANPRGIFAPGAAYHVYVVAVEADGDMTASAASASFTPTSDPPIG